MWRTLSSRLALRSALGLKHGSESKPGTSAPFTSAAISIVAVGVVFAAGLGGLHRYRSARSKDSERLTPDVAHPHLQLPDLVEQNLQAARLRMQRGDPAGAVVYAAQAAQHAADASVIGDDLLLSLGEIFAAACGQEPAILSALSREQPALNFDAEVPEGWRAQTLDCIHASVLALRRARGCDSLQWLAVAALSARPVLKPLVEKLLADALDADRHPEERAGVLPVLVDLDLPSIRHLQLAALHAEVARRPATEQRRLVLATCCIKLAGALVADVANTRPPADAAAATTLRARALHGTALRFLPAEADARGSASEEVRDAFGRLYYQRALMSPILGDGLLFQHLDAALTWYKPGEPTHAHLEQVRAAILLRAIQMHREQHGDELEKVL